MLLKKIPFYYLIITVFISSLVSFFIFHYASSQTTETIDSAFLEPQSSDNCDLKIKRLNGYQFIRPLLYAEPICESDNLMKHKSDIESVINSNKSQGNITTASVYLREFSKAEWIAINEDEKYSPGSLMKVPELIALYKMREKNPNFFEKKITFDHQTITNKHPVFLSKRIVVGNTYSIKELIEYMVVYSDNNATILLNKIVDENTFKRVFSDIGLEEPDFSLPQYPITAQDFSVFMKELFNASYLSQEDSEACLAMLSKSDFSEGLINGLPANCSVAHKFGEGGADTNPNFSETAIVYCGKKPYLLTVMTKGNDIKKLPKVISEISKKVYDIMSNRA